MSKIQNEAESSSSQPKMQFIYSTGPTIKETREEQKNTGYFTAILKLSKLTRPKPGGINKLKEH